MERSRVVLFALMCFSWVWLSRISGEEVELRVRAGSDVTIFSDCVSKDKFNLAWFRNCSHHHQPRLVLLPKYMVGNSFPRFSLELNSSNQTYDLLVKNISESDLGLYYCATYKQQITNKKTAGIRYEDVFHYGNRTTRLFLLDTSKNRLNSTCPETDCSVCWKLLVSVCPVCVLLSSLLSSTCVYFMCKSRIKVEKNAEKKRRNALNITDLAKVGEEDEVCYASLDLPSRGQKRLKKKRRSESSDFCTYSAIKTDRI
ncbi:hypothetical protein AMEX_G27226 [Astyanax mexicanus]|uniref:Ig-like domain-containing protein n=1 Tax=Astyanax mexicanus TaxID=7994 RepID=A0A8T2KRQ0_ASTMX|nr:hypothetical protein AMEX_G27226 [Astyanax mexicanus]